MTITYPGGGNRLIGPGLVVPSLALQVLHALFDLSAKYAQSHYGKKK